MATAMHITTADALLHIAGDGWRYELVEGDLCKREMTENDVLDGGDVVPGFQLRVGDLFAGLTGPRG